jgi:hypothetical protein
MIGTGTIQRKLGSTMDMPVHIGDLKQEQELLLDVLFSSASPPAFLKSQNAS